MSIYNEITQARLMDSIKLNPSFCKIIERIERESVSIPKLRSGWDCYYLSWESNNFKIYLEMIKPMRIS